MTQYVDFQKIKQRVSFEEILKHYNISFLKMHNGQLVGDCPLCGSDNDDAERFKVTPSKGAWKCWSCEESGNSLDLVALLEDTTLPKAALSLAKTFNITDCYYESGGKRKKKKKPGKADSETPEEVSKVSDSARSNVVNPTKIYGVDKAPADLVVKPKSREDETLLHNPPLDWEGLTKLDPSCDGLSTNYSWLPDEAEFFECGLCNRGIMKGRYAVPIHSWQGELLAYCGIALDDSETRLKFPPGRTYDPSLDLFNLHRALFYHDGIDVLVLVEDITEVFSMDNNGNPYVVATMQGVPSAQQILRLKSLDIWPDKRISVVWNEPSPELDLALARIAEFAWVNVSYHDL